MQTKIKLVYEDNHILVIEKPVNIPSQKDESGDEDLLTLLKKDIKERYNKPGNVYLGMVHRLDRPAGGIMVFAKTSKAASRLSGDIRSGKFRKIYIAVVHGKPEIAGGILKHYLLKDRKTNIVSVSENPAKGAKEAILEYKVIGYKDGLSLLKIDLVTGRPHQIRVQLSSTSHPIWGDQKYNQLSKQGEQLALWSAEIEFNHPITKERLTFKSMPAKKEPWNLFSFFKNEGL